jgi:hypothetical protein
VSDDGQLGLVGAFASPDAVIEAARQLRSLGFREVEAYTPYPVEGLDGVLRPSRRPWLPLIIAVAALFGAAWGYFIQYWDEALNYPINVGGRPHNSWPAFIVGDFEFTVLCAVAAAFFGLLVFCRLPRLYHPTLKPRSSSVLQSIAFSCVSRPAIRASSHSASAASSSATAPSMSPRCRDEIGGPYRHSRSRLRNGGLR